MLDEIKNIYQETADCLLPNWRDINKNELIKIASTLSNGPEKDGYISAIMLNYWNKIVKYYYKCKMVASPEDIHSWLFIALSYALDNKPWENPESSIYGDKNGPDKVVNTAMESRRLTFYQQLNRNNRKINSNLLSLDTLTQSYNDMFVPIYCDTYDYEVNEYVIDYFNKKDYFMAFLIDAILYEGVMTPDLNIKKLSAHFRKLDEIFCIRFSNKYKIKLDTVKKAVDELEKLSAYRFKNKVKYSLIVLGNKMKQ